MRREIKGSYSSRINSISKRTVREIAQIDGDVKKFAYGLRNKTTNW